MSTNSSILRWITLGMLTTIAAVGCATDSSRMAYYRSPDDKYQYGYSDLAESGDPDVFDKENYQYQWFLMAPDGTCYERIEYYITDPSGAGKGLYYQWNLPPFPRSDKNVFVIEDGFYIRTTNPHGTTECGVIIRTTNPHGLIKKKPSR